MGNLLPNLGVQRRAEVIAELAAEVVEAVVRRESCRDLNTCVLLQRGDMGSERLGEGDLHTVLVPPGVVVDGEEDADVIGGIGHPGVPSAGLAGGRKA